MLLIPFYLFLGLIIMSFLKFKKKPDRLTTLILALSLGLLFSLFLMDLLHNILTIFCTTVICLNIPLPPLFILLLAMSIMLIPFRINKLEAILSSLSSAKKHQLTDYLILISLLTVLAVISVNISSHSSGLHTDTALFLDQARSFLKYGRIKSNVLHQLIPAYYSVSPHHIYVPFYYSEFMAFTKISYVAAKIANIFISLLTVLTLYCLQTVKFDNGIFRVLPLILILLTPKFWTFFGVPLAGSEIIGTFQILTLILLLEVLNLRINNKRNLSNYFVLSLICYSILRTRVDYFALFIPTILGWHFALSLCKNIRQKAKTFLTVFLSYGIYLLLLRLSGSIICLLYTSPSPRDRG